MRVNSIDFLRGICLVLMILIHVTQQNTTGQFQESSLFNIIQTLNAAFVPASFIFIMGMAFYLAPRKKLLYHLKRGAFVFFSGYLLNFFRGVCPSFLSFFFIEEMSFSKSLILSYPFFLEFDILQFAGIVIILFFTLKRFLSDFWAMLVFLLILSLYYFYFHSAHLFFNNTIANYILSIFIGKNDSIFFPIFPWISFSIIGYLYAKIFKKFYFNKFFLLLSFSVGILCSLLGFFFIKNTCLEPKIYSCIFNEPPLTSVLWIFGNVITIFSFLTIVYPTKFENKFMLKILHWSKYTTSFYFIQWVIIGFFASFVPAQNFLGTFFVFIFVFVLTDIFLSVWIFFTSSQKKKES